MKQLSSLIFILASLLLMVGCQPGDSSLKTRSVTPGPPFLSMSPLVKDFGNVYVASMPVTASFVITNTGAGHASGCSAPVLGGSHPGDFSIVVDNCFNGNLAITSCSIGVRANPTTTGVRTATLSRTCNNGGTISTTTNGIKVTGVVANVIMDVSTRNFGNVAIGVASDSQTFVLTNIGSYPATGCTAPLLSGANAADFALTSDTCSTNSLLAGSTCSFVVTATPLAAGTRTATVSRTCLIPGTVTSTTNGLVVTGQTSRMTYLEKETDSFSTVTGLAGVTSVTVSPDGKFVYAAGQTDDAIEVFSRTQSTGALAQVSAVSQPTTAGLDGVMGLSMSPDGRHLYAASEASDAVVAMSRSLSTGALTFVASYPEGIAGVTGLNGAADVMVSPDGRAVYAVSNLDHALVAFTRTASTGALSFVTSYLDGVGGVDGLNGATALAASLDGRHIYVAGAGEDAVAVFSRTLSTGALSFVQVHKDNISSVDGLSGARDVTVSPDGRNVYVAGFNEDKLAVFSRNALTGALTYAEVHTDGVSGVNGLDGITAVRVTPDGRFVFATGANDKSIAIFSRHPTTGLLTYRESIVDDNATIDGLDDVADLFITPDGRNTYAAGTTDNAVAVFTNTLSKVGEPSFVSYAVDGSNSVTGLGGAQQVAISPDGKNIYATGNTDDALEVFTRDALTGNVTWLEKHSDGILTVDGLNGASGVAVSPDGLNVYVVSDADDAMAVFQRNPVNGALTYSTVITNAAIGGTGLTDPNFVTVSQDGKNVYLTSRGNDCVTVFNRHADTGALTYSTFLQDGVGGIDGLDGATFASLSPAGDFFHAVGDVDSGLVVFTRNMDTGVLTWLENHLDGVGGIVGLGGASSLALSFDNDTVYVSAANDDALLVFTRNVLSGSLTYSTSIYNGVAGVEGLDGAFQVAVSRDNSRVYVTAENDNALTLFARNLTTGLLTFSTSEANSTSGVQGMSAPRGLALSDDGQHAYCASYGSGGLVLFDED